MILYKCDLCKKIVPEKETCHLMIGTTFERDTYDICNECKTKLEGVINNDVRNNIHNPVCNSSDDVYRGQE